MRTFFIAFAVALLLAPPAPACVDGPHTRPMPDPAASAEAPSTKAFQAANHQMHQSMNIPFTGNADVDFVRGMIPHHQGAIDMAEVVIAHGHDPDIAALAASIVKAQEAEVRQMEEWLAEHASAIETDAPKPDHSHTP